MDFVKMSFENNKDVAVSLVASQLAQGIKSDGSLTDFPYAPFTIASKKRKSGLSAVTDHLTNYDTGESFKKLFAEIQGDKVIYGTKTDKEAAISDRMDGLAFSPTQDNKEELVRQHMKPDFLKMIREYVKL